MLFGLIIGDLLYQSFAVFGLALVAGSFGALFTFIRWAASAYLLYLAWQFWTTAHHDISEVRNTRHDLSSAAATGLAITMGNPKTIAFYLALLPLVIDLNNITVVSWTGVLIPLTVMVLIVVGSLFILGAVAIRKLLSSSRAQKHLHRGAAVAMASAAGIMILQEI